MPSDDSRLLGEILLRLKDVTAKSGLSRSTIYRRIAAGTFPAPLALGPGTVRWRLSDVDAWIEGLSVATRDDRDGKREEAPRKTASKG